MSFFLAFQGTTWVISGLAIQHPDRPMSRVCRLRPLALRYSKYWASRFDVDHIALVMIKALKLEPLIMRHELTDYEWTAVRLFLPNKPRGVPRVMPCSAIRFLNAALL